MTGVLLFIVLDYEFHDHVKGCFIFSEKLPKLAIKGLPKSISSFPLCSANPPQNTQMDGRKIQIGKNTSDRIFFLLAPPLICPAIPIESHGASYVSGIIF